MKWKQENRSTSAVEHQSSVFSPVAGGSETAHDGEPPKGGRVFMVWIPFVLCALTLVIAIVFTLNLTGRLNDTADRARVERLETRLEALRAETKRIDAALDKLAGLEGQVADLDRALAEIRDRLGRLSAETARIRKSHTALRQQLKARSPAKPPASATRPAKTFYHRVRRGETLYAIGRRYGTTVKRLQQDNHLGPRDKLHPGQVLKVRIP